MSILNNEKVFFPASELHSVVVAGALLHSRLTESVAPGARRGWSGVRSCRRGVLFHQTNATAGFFYAVVVIQFGQRGEHGSSQLRLALAAVGNGQLGIRGFV